MELFAVMTEVEKVAKGVRARVNLVDNAIWLLCARSGLESDERAVGRPAELMGDTVDCDETVMGRNNI